jgi:hypothetical protein
MKKVIITVFFIGIIQITQAQDKTYFNGIGLYKKETRFLIEYYLL